MNSLEQTKVVGDVLSISMVSATLMQILPPIAALFTILWTIIRLYETDTVRKMVGKKRIRRTRRGD